MFQLHMVATMMLSEYLGSFGGSERIGLVLTPQNFMPTHQKDIYALPTLKYTIQDAAMSSVVLVDRIEQLESYLGITTDDDTI